MSLEHKNANLFFYAILGFVLSSVAGVGIGILGSRSNTAPVLIFSFSLGLLALFVRGDSALVLLLGTLLLGEQSFEIANKTPQIAYVYFVIPLCLFANVLHGRSSARKMSVEARRMLLAWGIYIALLLPSVIFSTDMYISILRLSSIVLSALGWMLANRQIERHNDQHILLAVVIFGGLLSLRFIYQMVFVVGWETATDAYYRGIVNELPGFGRSNYIASFFVLVLPIAFGLVRSTRSALVRMVSFGSIVAMLFALMLTFSRGGFLAAILSIALLFLIDSSGKSRLLLMIFIAIAVIAFSLVNITIANTLLDRFFQKDDNMRFTLWQYAWDNFLTHWPVGLGLGSRILANWSDPLNDRLDAHNIVLGALMETGVVGTFGFLILYVFAIRALTRCIKAYRRAPYRHMGFAGLYAGLIGALFHAMIEPNFRGTVFLVLFWMLISVSISQLGIATRSQEVGACLQN